MERGFNLDYIFEMLLSGMKFTDSADGKELVLVIGNIGVGKTTLCNYLYGYPMERTMPHYLPAIDTVHKTEFKIGHQVGAQTLYAKPLVIGYNYSNSSTPVCLLDCPGFQGNRTIEKTIVENISTELAIRQSDGVRSMLILISQESFADTKAANLRELFKTLAHLFMYPLKMAYYSILVVTKLDLLNSSLPGNVLATHGIRRIIQHCESLSKELKQSNLNSAENITSMDYDNIATFLTAIIENGNIVCAYPLDGGKSRENILKKINSFKPAPTSILGYTVNFIKKNLTSRDASVGDESIHRKLNIADFNFSLGEKHREAFNNTLNKIAADLNTLREEIMIQERTVRGTYMAIMKNRERVNKLFKAQRAMEEMAYGGHKVYSDSYNVMIKSDNLLIKQKQGNYDSVCTRIRNIQEKLRKIDSDAPLLVHNEPYSRIFPWYNVFGWEEKSFKYDTLDPSIPILCVEKDLRNGAWKEEIDDRNNGKYSVTYVSNFKANPAEASMKVYIKTKHSSQNKVQIESMNASLEKLKSKRSELQFMITEKKSEKEALETNFDKLNVKNEQLKDWLQSELNDCVREIQFCKSESVCMHISLKKEKEYGRKLLSLLCDVECEKFNLLVKLDSLLHFGSAQIKNAVSDYKAMLSQKTNFSSLFDESATDILMPGVQEERVFGLKDPNTGKEITDLVVTRAGTPFDLYSLITEFHFNSEGNVPPFQFKRDFGYTEDIEIMDWNKIGKNQLEWFYKASSNQQISSFAPISESVISSRISSPSGLCKLSRGTKMPSTPPKPSRVSPLSSTQESSSMPSSGFQKSSIMPLVSSDPETLGGFPTSSLSKASSDNVLSSKPQSPSALKSSSPTSTALKWPLVSSAQESSSVSLVTSAFESSSVPLGTSISESLNVPLVTGVSESSSVPLETSASESLSVPLVTGVPESPSVSLDTSVSESFSGPLVTGVPESPSVSLDTSVSESFCVPFVTGAPQSSSVSPMSTYNSLLNDSEFKSEQHAPFFAKPSDMSQVPNPILSEPTNVPYSLIEPNAASEPLFSSASKSLSGSILSDQNRTVLSASVLDQNKAFSLNDVTENCNIFTSKADSSPVLNEFFRVVGDLPSVHSSHCISPLAVSNANEPTSLSDSFEVIDEIPISDMNPPVS